MNLSASILAPTHLRTLSKLFFREQVAELGDALRTARRTKNFRQEAILAPAYRVAVARYRRERGQGKANARG